MTITTHLPIALLLSLHLTACYTTSPTYGTRIDGSNGTVAFAGPGYETSINPFGWSLVVLATAGGAYAGHESGIALEWEKGEPASEKPIANAAIAGTTAGLTTMIFNAIFKPDERAFVADDAADWLSDIDDDLIMTGVLPGGGRVFGIADTADRSFAARSVSDLQLFRTAFPESPYLERVGAGAIASVSRDTLPLIPPLFPDAPWTEAARLRFIDESPKLSDAINATTRYPDLIDRAAARAASLVKTPDDALHFAKAFPESVEMPSVLRSVLPSARRTEIEKLMVAFPDAESQAALRRMLFDSTRTVAEVIAMTERFPELRGEGERKAAMVATTAGDYRLYLATFPEGAEAGAIKVKLQEMLRTPENLGKNVNTSANEFLPVISPDGKTLYINRTSTTENVGDYDDYDIWVSTLQANDEWSKIERMGHGLNNTRPNGVFSVTPDGNTLVLHGEYEAYVWTTAASMAHRTESGWSVPVPLEIEDYYNLGDYMQTFLANDGRTLLIALERRGGRGAHDLYVCFLKKNGSWTKPKTLGPTINTSDADDTPFLASDGRTLYFTSSGRGGEGGRDIFVSRREDDSWVKWSKPKNLGAPINTDKDDDFFFIPASGDMAYFSSDRSGFGQGDIFRVALPDDLRPYPVVLIAGTVRDRSDGKPLDAVIIYENLATGEEVGRARTDPATGGYKITLPPGANYGFRAEAADYIAVNDNLDLSELKVYREQTRDLLLVPIRAGEELRLNNLFFDVGKATLRKESHPELNRLAEIMKGRSAMSITIEGHTDSVGADEDNLRLSNARAEAVASYLASRGVGRTRLHPIGKGEEEPQESNATEAGKALNRRVEIVIGM